MNYLGKYILFPLLFCQLFLNGQTAVFYDRNDKDVYLNPSNAISQRKSSIGVRYQNDYPDIENSFNTYLGEINWKINSKNGLNFQILNDFMSTNQSINSFQGTYARRLFIKQFDIGIGLGFKYFIYNVNLSNSLVSNPYEPGTNHSIKNIDLPIGTYLKYNFKGLDSLHTSYAKMGFFINYPLKPDMAVIATGVSPKNTILGCSGTYSQYWGFQNEQFLTDLSITFLKSSDFFFYQIGWEQGFLSEDLLRDIGFNFDYYSNQTLGLGIHYEIANIRAKISRGLELPSFSGNLPNPYYLISVYYSFK